MALLESVCLARQSIYDMDLQPCGYELLYRPGTSANGSGVSD